MEMLRMDHITKIYPNGFVANKDVTFAVNEGEMCIRDRLQKQQPEQQPEQF